jgi:Bacterial regulatory protein, arsR family
MMAMLSRKHRVCDICDHLGFSYASASQRLSKLEKLYDKELFNRRIGQKIILSEIGQELGDNCLEALKILVPTYTEPKAVLPKVSHPCVF